MRLSSTIATTLFFILSLYLPVATSKDYVRKALNIFDSISKVGRLAMESKAGRLAMESRLKHRHLQESGSTCTQYSDNTTLWNVCYTCEIKQCSCGVFDVCSYGYCPFNGTGSLTSCKCGVSYNGTACSSCMYTDEAGNANVDCSNTVCEC